MSRETPKNLPPPLDREEWDFTEAVEFFGIDHVFLFEFCRSAVRESEEFGLLFNHIALSGPYGGKLQQPLNLHPLREYMSQFAFYRIEEFPDVPLIRNSRYRELYDLGRISIGSDPIPFRALPLNQIGCSPQDWE